MCVAMGSHPPHKGHDEPFLECCLTCVPDGKSIRCRDGISKTGRDDEAIETQAHPVICLGKVSRRLSPAYPSIPLVFPMESRQISQQSYRAGPAPAHYHSAS